jgi:hypothetical protein
MIVAIRFGGSIYSSKLFNARNLLNACELFLLDARHELCPPKCFQVFRNSEASDSTSFRRIEVRIRMRRSSELTNRRSLSLWERRSLTVFGTIE